MIQFLLYEIVTCKSFVHTFITYRL